MAKGFPDPGRYSNARELIRGGGFEGELKEAEIAGISCTYA